MNLRAQAAADLRAILEDSSGGFGWPATITDPDGHSGTVTGTYRDVHQAIDPQTGEFVTGRQASLVVPIAGLTAVGLDWPRGIASQSSKPWLVSLMDLQGMPRLFKVAETRPDELGCIVLILEVYELADS